MPVLPLVKESRLADYTKLVIELGGKCKHCGVVFNHPQDMHSSDTATWDPHERYVVKPYEAPHSIFFRCFYCGKLTFYEEIAFEAA
jgi:hypothetical protein